MSASIVITTSGSIVGLAEVHLPVLAVLVIRTVICDSGLRYWYWTIVFALRNFGASSWSSVRSSNSFPMYCVDLVGVLEIPQGSFS